MLGRKPNKEERAWIKSIVELGCIVCLNEFSIYSPASVHHMNGSKKEGCNLETLPLCWTHHQEGRNDHYAASRHPYKAEFEKRYGTEQELLTQVQGLLEAK